MRSKFPVFCFCLFLFVRCDSGANQGFQFEPQNRQVPGFNADSAYAYVQRQVQMGPRNPGSEGHQKGKDFLINQLEKYAGENNVFAQRFTYTGYEGDTLNLANVIAAFNTKSTHRIMLCAHWDTRPRSDEAESNTDQPIAGADDGASGVGVLLEMARLFSEHPPPIGVDIILFDGEDYGKQGDNANYFVGSRYWSNNPPVANYRPRFGILLDMVGGEGAKFPKEGYSMQYAPSLVNEIWNIARQAGYGDMFLDESGARISDDHYVVNQIKKIPTIDIIRHSVGEQGNAVFAPYWHTQNDNMDVIDRGTLGAVGEVLSELIYNRI